MAMHCKEFGMTMHVNLESRAQAWRVAIKKGDDELDRDEGVTYHAEVLAEITEATIGSMRGGTPVDADVLP